MTEPQAEYVTKTVTDEDGDKPKPWRCKCGLRLGWMYLSPRRLIISTEDIFFEVRGDVTITHTECGAVNSWHHKRELHGILEELETTQQIIETDELTVTK